MKKTQTISSLKPKYFLKTEPTPYQKKVEDDASKKARFLIQFIQGSGKTRAAFGVLCKRQLPDPGKKVLCVVPKNGFIHWLQEIETHTNYKAELVKGTRSYRENVLANSDADLLILNPQNLRIMKDSLVRAAKAGKFDAIILDELTIWKRRSATVNATKKIVEHIPVRLGLTGGLVTESLFDVFNPFNILFGNKYFGSDFIHWREKYFAQPKDEDGEDYLPGDPRGYKWEPTEYGKRIIKSTLNLVGYFVTAEEAGLPEETEQTKYFRLSREQVAALKSLQDEWEVYLDGKHYEYSFIGQKLAKAKQIVSGFMYRDGEQPYVFDYNPRLQCLNSVVEEFGDEPFVVFVDFRFEKLLVKSLLQGIGKEVCENWEEFNPGKGDCYIGTYSKDARIIELQRANQCVHYHRPWWFDEYNQSRFRVRRKGSKHQFVNHTIITSNSMPDRLVDKILRKKSDLSKFLYDSSAEELRQLWGAEKRLQ